MSSHQITDREKIECRVIETKFKANDFRNVCEDLKRYKELTEKYLGANMIGSLNPCIDKIIRGDYTNADLKALQGLFIENDTQKRQGDGAHRADKVRQRLQEKLRKRRIGGSSNPKR